MQGNRVAASGSFPLARAVNRKVVIDAKSFLTVEMTLKLHFPQPDRLAPLLWRQKENSNGC